jgi:colanic acid biosynthesis glycosyl transferase WcaI
VNATPALVFVNRYYRPDESATSQMLTDLAERLVQGNGASAVRIICSRQLYEDAAARLPRGEVLSGVEIRRVWTSRFGRQSLVGRALDYASFYVSAAVEMLRTVKRGDILVAKTDPPMISVVAAAVAWLRGAQLVNWLQDVFPEVADKLTGKPLPGWLYRPVRAIRDRSLQFARFNVVLGERMAAHIAAQGVPQDRIRIIENWADGTAISPRPTPDSQLRTQLGLESSFVVGYSGNLGRAHEYETFLRAATLLRGTPGIAFLFIGGGAKFNELRRQAEESGLAQFRFLSYQPRTALCDSLAAMDVHLACLLPDLEGLIVPSKAYGVLAAGRPLISIGDLDGELARMVRTGRCGSGFACGDGEGLAAEILRLSRDRQECEAMGQRARMVFEASYSLDSAVTRWGKLLGSLHAPLYNCSSDSPKVSSES